MLAGWGAAHAQVSPGPLSKAHSSLEGNLNCFECHGLRSSPMQEHCLDCHKEVDFLKDARLGLHGQGGLEECARCHPEHAGADFELIEWKEGSPEAFDHARTGWPLTGRHAALRCAQCHQEKFRSSPAARLAPGPHSSPGWIGLQRDCGSCHEDIHRGALGKECVTCHDGTAWKPARSFDHAKTAFPLEGRHATLTCAPCHLAPHLDLARDAGGRPVPLYKPLPHRECSSCHRDPHEKWLGDACSSCHTAADFRKVTTAGFDHERTRYPLRGGHRRVSCEACHGAAARRVARPSFATCTGCHADAHAGQATLAGRSADCGACHTHDGWTPSTFTVARHAESSYALEGRHATVRCAACHVREKDPARARALGTSAVAIRPAHGRCMDCHRDAHRGELASREGGGACEGCHTVGGWSPSRFTAADHASLALALDGAHAKAACSACHGAKRPGLPPIQGPSEAGLAAVKLRLDEKECAACHADPHDGRYGAGAARAEAAARSGACLDCHGLQAFRPSTIDAAAHARYTFAVEGAHRAVPCLDCHDELGAAPAASSLILAQGPRRSLAFAGRRARCEECHKDPHGGQFIDRAKAGCASCHTVTAWKPAGEFDHDRDSAFALVGSHARVACARCHRLGEIDGASRVIYRPLSSRCASCHVTTPAASGASPS